jgi:hypothetical protein
MDAEKKFSITTIGKSLKSRRYNWPNPEDSTGKQYKNAKLRRYECWEAVGEARQKFEEIAPEIKAYLEKSCDQLAHTVVWTIYMIGRTRKELIPTIMVCGIDKNARTHVEKMIKESKIMNRYPGFRIGNCTEEFQHYARRKRRKRRKPTVQICSGSSAEVMRAIQRLPSDTNIETTILRDRLLNIRDIDQEFWNVTDGEDSQETQVGTAAGGGNAILYSPSDIGPGMRILIQGFHGDSLSLRQATGGGFIRHRESIFLTTVAHAFHEDVVKAIPNPPENCDIEFELDGDSDVEEEDDIELSSRCSVSFAPSELDRSTISGRTFSDTTSEFEQSITTVQSTDQIINNSGANLSPVPIRGVSAQKRELELLVKSDDLLLPVGEHIILSTTGSRPSLDYCLIEVEANDLLNSKQIPLKFDKSSLPVLSGIVMNKPGDVDVVATTGSGGLLKGRLSGTQSFLMLPGSNVVQEVWTVRHDTEVVNGDCGAWVIDASNGNLFGHIVGGSPSLKVSYIIPAHFIFDDLKARFDGEWKPANVVPERVVPDPVPAPGKSEPADVVLERVVPDPVTAPGKSKLRRSWYIK